MDKSTKQDRRSFRRRINLAASLIAMILVIAYMLNVGLNNKQSTSDHAEKLTIAPSILGENVVISQFNKNGTLNYRINASRSESISVLESTGNDFAQENNSINAQKSIMFDEFESIFSTSNTTDRYIFLDHPIIHFFENSAVLYQLYSKGGVISENEGKLIMVDEVSARDIASQTQLSTSKLVLDSQHKTISSTESVKITGKDFQMSGKGLSANIAQGNWKILSEVTSVFQPSYIESAEKLD